MRNPYIAGRWVRGQHHYGRERLIESLLHSPDNAIWLVGTRRMGKTSLLKQLEWQTADGTGPYVPVVWDMQGCVSPQDLALELCDALVDVEERFTRLGIEVAGLEGLDASSQLRYLARRVGRRGKQLLVLVDEAEVLIEIARRDPIAVDRLRRALQDARLRTVITSTKHLIELNRVQAESLTSPFLFGFQMVSLSRLDDGAARALVRQMQAQQQVGADDGVVDDVLMHTNGQPYLIQYLCYRLFESQSDGTGTLRAVQDKDLVIDHILGGFFQVDFQYLTRTERRLVLAVAELSIAKPEELLVALNDVAPRRILFHLEILERLGYLRQIFGQWALGNEFLRRWMADQSDTLTAQLPNAPDDGPHEMMLETERTRDVKLLRAEIARVEAALRLAEEAAERGAGEDLARRLEQIDRLHKELARLRRTLATSATSATLATSATSDGPSSP